MRCARRILLATRLPVGVLLSVPVFAQVTQRVSLAAGGAQGDGGSMCYSASISADGRFVAFESLANNVVPGDTNGTSDVFVRDRVAGTTERISVDSNGTQGNGASGRPSISPDGRYVVFTSSASNLVPGDANAAGDVFVRDRLSGTTELASVASNGAQGDSYSDLSSISADGRYVTFYSQATNLVPGDANGRFDVFVRDRVSGATVCASVDSGGVPGNGDSFSGSISADGRFAAFYSSASDLVPGDTNGQYDIFVRDLQNGTTTRVSLGPGGAQGNDASYGPSISSDGRCVAFHSFASNLVHGDSNGHFCDIFVRDTQSGTTEVASVDSAGVWGNDNSGDASISSDGRYVAFHSIASNLVPGDANAALDVFVRDRSAGTTRRVSVDSSGTEGDGSSCFSSISAAGRFVVFRSDATNLVHGDTNGLPDVFVHDRDATGFASLCDPGFDGVIACPCSNPPGGLERGCDNSAATGGAMLTASGIAYLSMDNLVFVTSGERPTAFSILLQGNALAASGIVYGQGVRCMGGALERLYAKSANAGSITAPDFGAGDPTVSARSAAKGDVIRPGQSRWYLVYYRDPIVLGGCPASSTFNATQTGRVDWSF